MQPQVSDMVISVDIWVFIQNNSLLLHSCLLYPAILWRGNTITQLLNKHRRNVSFNRVQIFNGITKIFVL